MSSPKSALERGNDTETVERVKNKESAEGARHKQVAIKDRQIRLLPCSEDVMTLGFALDNQKQECTF